MTCRRFDRGDPSGLILVFEYRHFFRDDSFDLSSRAAKGFPEDTELNEWTREIRQGELRQSLRELSLCGSLSSFRLWQGRTVGSIHESPVKSYNLLKREANSLPYRVFLTEPPLHSLRLSEQAKNSQNLPFFYRKRHFLC